MKTGGAAQGRLARRRPSSAQAMAQATPSPHGLVIEDHTALQLQIVALLLRAGLRVDEAADGRLGLSKPLWRSCPTCWCWTWACPVWKA